jgi:hypothetical protein
MENQFTISIKASDQAAALEQTKFTKVFLKGRGYDAQQQQAALKPGEAGAEWLAVLTVVAPVVKELLSVIGEWIKSRSEDAKARNANVKIEIEGKNGKKVSIDVSGPIEDEGALIKKISDQLL